MYSFQEASILLEEKLTTSVKLNKFLFQVFVIFSICSNSEPKYPEGQNKTK